MTGKLSGHSRVFACAKARAVELLCAVAATGTIGRAPGTTQNPTNVSACALYLPCEPSLGLTGVHGATAPTGEDPGDGPLLIERDIPFAEIRRLREAGAEVRSEEHTSELQSLMRISYAVFSLDKKKKHTRKL